MGGVLAAIRRMDLDRAARDLRQAWPEIEEELG
jgi:hypothetical protein